MDEYDGLDSFDEEDPASSESEEEAEEDIPDAVVGEESDTEVEDRNSGVKFLTKFEKARVLGVRTQQIKSGAQIFVERKPSDTDFDVAMRELLSRRMPLIIRRYGASGFVDVSVNDLVLI